jgi:hypothetical protein
MTEDNAVWPMGICSFNPRIYARKDKGDEIVRIQKERIIKLIKEELGR